MDASGSKTLEIMSYAPWYHNWQVRMASKYIKGDILEIGAGIGNMSVFLSKCGDVTAIDINKKYLSLLKKRKIKSGYGDIESGKYFFQLKGRVKRFDTAFSSNVFEHISQDDLAIKNVYNLLKKNGMFVLIVPAYSWAYGRIDKGLGHYRRYNVNDLKRKFNTAGFVVEKARYINWLSLLGWFINSRILNRPILSLRQIKIFNKIAPFFLFIENFIELPFGQSVMIVGKK